MHPLLLNLQAFYDNPCEVTVSRLRDEGWYIPLWMGGRTRKTSDGLVAFSFEASMLEGLDQPVLLVYPDEALARADSPDSSLISYPLSVIAELAHQQKMDVAVTDGEIYELLDHKHLLLLRDMIQLEENPLLRNRETDGAFMNRLEVYLREAVDYCRNASDVERMLLAAVQPGGAAMRAYLLLRATNVAAHHEALDALFRSMMQPGDCLDCLDPMNWNHRRFVKALEGQTPSYVREASKGWWARLTGRRPAPQLVLLVMDIVDDEAA